MYAFQTLTPKKPIVLIGDQTTNLSILHDTDDVQIQISQNFLVEILKSASYLWPSLASAGSKCLGREYGLTKDFLQDLVVRGQSHINFDNGRSWLVIEDILSEINKLNGFEVIPDDDSNYLTYHRERDSDGREIGGFLFRQTYEHEIKVVMNYGCGAGYCFVSDKEDNYFANMLKLRETVKEILK